MALALPDLPKYLVLEPLSTVRVEMRLEAPSCEIDVELESPRPGRSFVLLIGHKDGPFVQRVRLAGRARIYFDPQSPGEYVLLVANPQNDPIVLRLRGRNVGKVPAKSGTRTRSAQARRKVRRGARTGPKGVATRPRRRSADLSTDR